MSVAIKYATQNITTTAVAVSATSIVVATAIIYVGIAVSIFNETMFVL